MITLNNNNKSKIRQMRVSSFILFFVCVWKTKKKEREARSMLSSLLLLPSQETLTTLKSIRTFFSDTKGFKQKVKSRRKINFHKKLVLITEPRLCTRKWSGPVLSSITLLKVIPYFALKKET